MSLLESGKVVKVELIFKVPLELAPGLPPEVWALDGISLSLMLRRNLVHESVVGGTMKPNLAAPA